MLNSLALIVTHRVSAQIRERGRLQAELQYWNGLTRSCHRVNGAEMKAKTGPYVVNPGLWWFWKWKYCGITLATQQFLQAIKPDSKSMCCKLLDWKSDPRSHGFSVHMGLWDFKNTPSSLSLTVSNCTLNKLILLHITSHLHVKISQIMYTKVAML